LRELLLRFRMWGRNRSPLEAWQPEAAWYLKTCAFC